MAWTYGNNHHLLGYNNPQAGSAPEQRAVLQALSCGQSTSRQQTLVPTQSLQLNRIKQFSVKVTLQLHRRAWSRGGIHLYCPPLWQELVIQPGTESLQQLFSYNWTFFSKASTLSETRWVMSLAVERGIEKAADPIEMDVTPASLKMIKTYNSRPQPWGNQCEVYKST